MTQIGKSFIAHQALEEVVANNKRSSQVMTHLRGVQNIDVVMTPKSERYPVGQFSRSVEN